MSLYSTTTIDGVNDTTISTFLSGVDTLTFDGEAFGGASFADLTIGTVAAGDLIIDFYASTVTLTGLTTLDVETDLIFRSVVDPLGGSLDGSSSRDELVGSEFDDVLNGKGRDDILFGLGGDDRLLGELGNDHIEGGIGLDVLIGGRGDDNLDGGDDDDVLNGGADNDMLDGGLGDDTLIAGTGDNTLLGGDGEDVFVIDANGGETIIGDFQQGLDVIKLRDPSGSVTGADVSARIAADGNLVVEFGTASVRLVEVSNFDSNDFLYVMNGTGNADTLVGGSTNDVINGKDGDDDLSGRGGADQLNGQGGADDLFGQDGDDILDGSDGDDNMFGGRDNDELLGGLGADYGNGGAGEDTLFGEDGNDILDGGADNDRVYGGRGEDRVLGRDGNDFLYGGLDNDVIIGGAGSDTLFGQGGADTFEFDTTSGDDTVRDFVQGVDTLDVGALGVTAIADFDSVSVVGGDTVITEGSVTITLDGFTDPLLESDFAY